MGLFDDVGRADVLSALEEHDQLGAEEFRHRYGFAPAGDYVVWHDGRTYDSKAVLGVARKYAGGTPAASEDFRGGMRGAATLLTELGFLVTSTDPYAGVGGPVTGSWREASALGDAAHEAWADAARDVLLQAARRYRAVVTDDDLVVQVMYRTGVRTDRPGADWLGDVLARVGSACASRDEPLLAALCVATGGRVAPAYAAAAQAYAGFAPPSPADHAAQQRLACYRHFKAAGLPADGGTVSGGAGRAARPTSRTPRPPRARKATSPRTSPSRAPAASAPAAATCPTCYMTLPVTGVCDNCA